MIKFYFIASISRLGKRSAKTLVDELSNSRERFLVTEPTEPSAGSLDVEML